MLLLWAPQEATTAAAGGWSLVEGSRTRRVPSSSAAASHLPGSTDCKGRHAGLSGECSMQVMCDVDHKQAYLVVCQRQREAGGELQYCCRRSRTAEGRQQAMGAPAACTV